MNLLHEIGKNTSPKEKPIETHINFGVYGSVVLVESSVDFEKAHVLTPNMPHPIVNKDKVDCVAKIQIPIEGASANDQKWGDDVALFMALKFNAISM